MPTGEVLLGFVLVNLFSAASTADFLFLLWFLRTKKAASVSRVVSEGYQASLELVQESAIRKTALMTTHHKKQLKAQAKDHRVDTKKLEDAHARALKVEKDKNRESELQLKVGDYFILGHHRTYCGSICSKAVCHFSWLTGKAQQPDQVP